MRFKPALAVPMHGFKTGYIRQKNFESFKEVQICRQRFLIKI